MLLFLCGRGGLGKGEEAKIDPKTSICVICTDEVWLPRREIKGGSIKYSKHACGVISFEPLECTVPII